MMKFRLKLWHKVIIGMALGVLCGILLKEKAVFLKPVGTLFINCIKMVVIPLIFFAVLYGMTSIGDANTFTRLGLRALSIYSCTTVFAVSIGLGFATFFKPGVGLNIALEVDPTQHQPQHSIGEILINIIPTNPIEAMATGNTLQVVVFSFFTGFALILIGEKGREIKELVVSAANLVFKMVELIIKLTPYGVFALMSWVVGEYGVGIVAALSKFIMVVLAALILQYCLFGIMLCLCGLNPFIFYRKMTNIQSLAFATASSKATLAVSMQDLYNKMGVSRQTLGFVLPLGASMNMDATAIYLGICAVFFAQIIGVDLSWGQYGIILFTATIGSIGAAGFPGGSIVMMGMVLSAVGLPLECVSIIIGIDRFLEMLRTMINITGDCAVTVIVDKLEKTLDIKQYNAPVDAYKQEKGF